MADEEDNVIDPEVLDGLLEEETESDWEEDDAAGDKLHGTEDDEAL